MKRYLFLLLLFSCVLSNLDAQTYSYLIYVKKCKETHLINTRDIVKADSLINAFTLKAPSLNDMRNITFFIHEEGVNKNRLYIYVEKKIVITKKNGKLRYKKIR